MKPLKKAYYVTAVASALIIVYAGLTQSPAIAQKGEKTDTIEDVAVDNNSESVQVGDVKSTTAVTKRSEVNQPVANKIVDCSNYQPKQGANSVAICEAVAGGNQNISTGGNN